MKKIRIITSDKLSDIRKLLSDERPLLVADSHVVDYLEPMGLQDFPTYILEACESDKTIETALDICRWLIDNNADKGSLLLAIGGGITSDLAGFAASIYKRGIRYANVPTTLLAQVDAGIGGKTGVNLDGLKNMLGVIRQPEFTWICPAFLETLPRREYISGCAEMLKSFLIASSRDYAEAVEAIRSGKHLGNLPEKAAKIKAAIVEKDTDERGLRRILNLGHTWGHAIEWYQSNRGISDKLTHGEAIAIGIVKAAEISEERAVAKIGLAERIRKDFEACALPTDLPIEEKELQKALEQDKKNIDGRPHLVLLQKIGKAIIE